MTDFIKTKKTYIMLLAILFVFVSLSETTYSLFLSSNSVAELNYNTGLLDLQFTEDDQIILENFLPITDNEGIKLTPYTLKIKNTGSLPYLFDLMLVSSNENSDSIINNRYIKVKVDNNLPNNLSALDNKISANNIIYPEEEKTFKINVWLDIITPNTELGKKYNAKVVATGSAIYKTLDNSGANHPDLNSDMIPVYYDSSTSSWRIADNTNTIRENKWYSYQEQEWANAIVLKNNDKQIYDITRNNDLTINDFKVNNGNLIIENKYLNIGLSNYNYDNITNILRVKFNDLTADNIYLISNDNISYYYDTINKKFNFNSGKNTVASKEYNLEKDKWYIIGYSYDTNKVTFYINGQKLDTLTINGKINYSNSSFKVGTDSSSKIISKITIGNIFIYNRILTDSEISKNYQTSIVVINDGLICGYNQFIPMTLKEYYLNKNLGFAIENKDILAQYVWIPRYKYRLWNVTGENNTDSYNAYTKGIDIVFEKSTMSTGEISCQNNECTKEDNNKYYTHPAFKNVDRELTGFWVSKYEISINDGIVESKMGNPTWKNNNLINYYQALINMNNVDNYQIIKNSEWGAIAYLSHSEYGLCLNNVCKKIGHNNTYTSGNDSNDTTTGNIYGIFDMSGSAMEYTMSNYNNKLTLDSSLFKDTPINNNAYELYQINSFILGDATKEILINNKTWYDSVFNYSPKNNEWIIRGGDTTENNQGIFAFTTASDNTYENLSTRIIYK